MTFKPSVNRKQRCEGERRAGTPVKVKQRGDRRVQSGGQALSAIPSVRERRVGGLTGTAQTGKWQGGEDATAEETVRLTSCIR